MAHLGYILVPPTKTPKQPVYGAISTARRWWQDVSDAMNYHEGATCGISLRLSVPTKVEFSLSLVEPF